MKSLSAREWDKRVSQWVEFERWHESHDPARMTAPELSLRWAGELLNLIRRMHGPAETGPGDYAGVRVMRNGLAKLHTRRSPPGARSRQDPL